jgi:secondary thiamine-phosphate synthase enzyme
VATRALTRDRPDPGLRVFTDEVLFRTEARLQFIDLTAVVAERIRRSEVMEGIACVQVRHTTAAIVVNEDEPLLLEDVEALLDRAAPSCLRYRHDQMELRPGVAPDERRNGDAHCRALLLGASVSLCVASGALQLGRWQRVLLVELDGPRPRTISIVVLGAGRRP